MSDDATRQICRLGWATLAAGLFFGIFIFPTTSTRIEEATIGQ